MVNTLYSMNLLFWSPSNTATANHIIRANDLCRLMYFATLNHVDMTKYPGFDVSAEITLDEAGARRLWQIKRLAFGQLGKNYYFIPSCNSR